MMALAKQGFSFLGAGQKKQTSKDDDGKTGFLIHGLLAEMRDKCRKSGNGKQNDYIMRKLCMCKENEYSEGNGYNMRNGNSEGNGRGMGNGYSRCNLLQEKRLQRGQRLQHEKRLQ